MEKSESGESLPLQLGGGETRWQWLKSWFAVPHKRARLLRGSFYYVLPIVLVIILGISIGWVFRTHTLAPPPPPPTLSGRSMTMSLELDSIDPLANQGVIAVQWTLLQDSCMVENNNNTSDCPPVNIYMDPTMFSGSGGGPPSGNNSDPQSPVFTIFAEGWNDLFANYPNFETSLNIGTRTDKLVDSLLNYPFDRYIAELWMYATVDGTNNPVNLIIVDASGVAFGFDAMVASIDNSDNQLDVFLNIQRTVLVRAYVVTIILAMWLVTLLLLVIAIKAIFFRGKVDTTILAAPVATLFAFTSLRTAMPGAPSGFGAIIDFVGTLPTLATLITITVVCLLHVLLRSIGDEAKKPSALEA